MSRVQTRLPSYEAILTLMFRNNFTAGLTWQTPGVHGDQVARAILNNWALDDHLLARTAFPVTLLGNQLTNPANGTIYYAGLNLVPNEPVYRHVNGLPETVKSTPLHLPRQPETKTEMPHVTSREASEPSK